MNLFENYVDNGLHIVKKFCVQAIPQVSVYFSTKPSSCIHSSGRVGFSRSKPILANGPG